MIEKLYLTSSSINTSLLHCFYPSFLLQQKQLHSCRGAEVALTVEDERPRLEVLQPSEGIKVNSNGQLVQFLPFFC